MTELTIPTLSLVVLIGASGSGKSTFARTHFKSTEVLSSDVCRGLVSDNENDQSATTDAFDVLHFIAAKRLAAGRLTVVDATNVQPAARKPLLELARRYHVIPVAIVFDLPERVCLEHNRSRPDRDFGPHVIPRQLMDPAPVASRTPERRLPLSARPTWCASCERRRAHRSRAVVQPQAFGPWTVRPDWRRPRLFDELVSLLDRLGYRVRADDAAPYGYAVTPPDGLKVVFLGDLVDRGPAVPGVLRLVMSMVSSGAALCVPGNHEIKLLRALNGRHVQISHGLAQSLEQLAQEPPPFVEEVKRFIDGLKGRSM